MFVMFHSKEYCGHVCHVSWKGVLQACLSCFMVRSTVGMFVMFHGKEYCGHVCHVS